MIAAFAGLATQQAWETPESVRPLRHPLAERGLEGGLLGPMRKSIFLSLFFIVLSGCSHNYVRSEQLRISAINLYCSPPWFSPEAQLDAEHHLQLYEAVIEEMSTGTGKYNRSRAFPYYQKALVCFRDALEVVRKRHVLVIQGFDLQVYPATKDMNSLASRYSIRPRDEYGKLYFTDFLLNKIWTTAGNEISHVISGRHLNECF